MTQDARIPLCRAEFLQDISIEFGRRLAKNHPFRTFNVEAENCEHEGKSLERLTVRASTFYGTEMNLTLWEDRTVWVTVVLLSAENNGDYKVGFYPKCEGFTPERIAESFRETVSVSTRLCYGESPLPILRKIWKHTGDVKTTGSLDKSRKSPITG